MGESDPQPFRDQILNLARLPISPISRVYPPSDSNRELASLKHAASTNWARWAGAGDATRTRNLRNGNP